MLLAGIGFKSVFLVSSQPHIFSNGYRVRFNEEPDQNCGMIRWKLFESAQLSKLHPELLLFLSKIKCLYVHGCNPEGAHSVSIVSICSQTDDEDLRGKTAKSHVVQLSVKESMCDNQDLCKYYLWGEAFPVKPGNRVGIRSDVEKWVVTLAFPFGERLRRGTSCIGVFAFLPTAMVTNFPFVIQADFILASSRECILLDNVWNLGILECVPTAFVNAFKLQGLKIVPHERFSDNSSTFFFSQPQHAVRILPRFRDILVKMERKMALLISLYSLKNVLHSSLDLEKYSAALDFLGVPFADDQWYIKCIKSSNLVLHVSDNVYVDHLGFIADNETIFSSEYFKSVPLLKYIDQQGNLKFCSVTKTTTEAPKIRCAMELETHRWLSKCSLLFRCPDTMYFLPTSTQKALLNRSSDETKKKHRRSSSICRLQLAFIPCRSEGLYSISLCFFALQSCRE
ncbi:hypothetical protein RchiOBHm_Chr6g0275111 [Rosa chinensis]|uniref:Uncharacterized protein n=1 Tax=Rosa chinensis TaxID=74649 RepID=A0A2P6PRW5_ROSCH|nr:hypothetical protein RchiOBHm_Chr6g0275111 [Rosa chinensis]